MYHTDWSVRRTFSLLPSCLFYFGVYIGGFASCSTSLSPFPLGEDLRKFLGLRQCPRKVSVGSPSVGIIHTRALEMISERAESTSVLVMSHIFLFSLSLAFRLIWGLSPHSLLNWFVISLIGRNAPQTPLNALEFCHVFVRWGIIILVSLCIIFSAKRTLKIQPHVF